MVDITFTYTETDGIKRRQSCHVRSVDECKRIYGLDEDPQVVSYEIEEVVGTEE